jgi:hypothetical protein
MHFIRLNTAKAPCAGSFKLTELCELGCYHASMQPVARNPPLRASQQTSTQL